MVRAPLEDLPEDSLGDLRRSVSRCIREGRLEYNELTFMIGMGSSPGAPRSSIMFLMSMERSAILRSEAQLATRSCDKRGDGAKHTSDDLDIVRANELDLLVTLGGHDDSSDMCWRSEFEDYG